MFIYSFNKASEGAKLLKESLDIKRIRTDNSKFKGAPHKTVINWGSSKASPEILKCKILNHPDNVAKTVNKLNFFQLIAKSKHKDIIPPFVTTLKEAIDWCGQGFTVVARTVLTGSGGDGIVIMEKDNPDAFVKASLYVKYVPKHEEYRVHVVKGKVIDIQRKTLSKDKAAEYAAKGEQPNFKVRNLENGFIYQRANVNPDKSVGESAVKALEVVGLDFGAVDIVVHVKTGVPYVLEVNTAPGLVGTTVESYTKAFKGI